MTALVKWALVAAGVLVVILATVAIGSRDEEGETVAASEWAESVCGTIGVWRGEIEAIVEDVRTPPAKGATGTQEPQSETPQGRTGFVRVGLERAMQAAETLVEGIDRAGIPDTAEGEQVANDVSNWANASLDALEGAEESLDEEADTLEASLEQLAEATRALGTTLAGGAQVIADAAITDPELRSAVEQSGTCQQVREER